MGIDLYTASALEFADVVGVSRASINPIVISDMFFVCLCSWLVTTRLYDSSNTDSRDLERIKVEMKRYNQVN